MSGKRADARDMSAAARRVQALELRKAGVSYRVIADRLGVSVAQAHSDVMSALHALAEKQQETAAEVQVLELERLDMALLAIAQQVKAGNLGAIDRWIRLSESRRKLLGSDAPTRVQHSGRIDWSQVSDADLDAFLAGGPPPTGSAGGTGTSPSADDAGGQASGP